MRGWPTQMDNNTLPLHLRRFNDKVRAMTQTNAKTLLLTASEASNLQAEIFVLLAENVRLNQIPKEPLVVSTVLELDGGSFGA